NLYRPSKAHGQLRLPGRIILSLLLCVSCYCLELHARESFELKIGENIQVLSDKAFRDSAKNRFEAVGNVIITHQRNSIYGERASLDFGTGDAQVVGNVRYVGSELTMYGS